MDDRVKERPPKRARKRYSKGKGLPVGVQGPKKPEEVRKWFVSSMLPEVPVRAKGDPMSWSSRSVGMRGLLAQVDEGQVAQATQALHRRELPYAGEFSDCWILREELE